MSGSGATLFLGTHLVPPEGPAAEIGLLLERRGMAGRGAYRSRFPRDTGVSAHDSH